MSSAPKIPNDEGRELPMELYSPLAKPNKKEWDFPLGKVFALIKPTPDDNGAIILVLRWAAQLAPRSHKTGVIWNDFPMPDEATARERLAECDAKDANYYYEQLSEGYNLPTSW